MQRLVRHAALLAAVTLVAVLAGGQPAAAHATLLVTTPIADGAVAEPPAHVELVFNEPVVVHAVSVRDRAGEQYPLAFRPCGDDCFVTDTRWADGDNLLTLRVPAPQPLPIGAGTFLSSQPYGTGVAPQAVVLPDDEGGRIRLRVGFPAERRFAELVVAPDGRLISEVLTGPKHLIHRSFQYQEQ